LAEIAVPEPDVRNFGADFLSFSDAVFRRHIDVAVVERILLDPEMIVVIFCGTPAGGETRRQT